MPTAISSIPSAPPTYIAARAVHRDCRDGKMWRSTMMLQPRGPTGSGHAYGVGPDGASRAEVRAAAIARPCHESERSDEALGAMVLAEIVGLSGFTCSARSRG